MSPSDSSQRIVVVTGSSPGGLGYAICKEFRARGWRVFATSRNVESLKPLETDGCDILSLDVTKPESITSAANELSVRTGGRLDALVNNAAISPIGPSITEDPFEARSVIETNLLGPVLVVQAFVPIIIKSNNGKGGVIVNVTSVTALISTPWTAIYSATKAGLRCLSSAWRMEFRNFGISVVDVVGGLMETRMLDASVETIIDDSGSPLYWNWSDIDKRRRKAVGGYRAARSSDVARDIVVAASKKSPPANLYTGA